MSEPWSSRAARFARRHRFAAQVAVAGLALCMIVAGASALWLGKLARSELAARKDAEAAKTQAEVARRENLRSSALFLAKSIAQEIDLRWRILEAEAASPRLRDLLQKMNQAIVAGRSLDQPLRSEVQTWLDKRFIANSDAVKTTSWIVNTIEGTQVARVPEADSIGKNYAHRDYFHGKGRDQIPESVEAVGLRPLEGRIVHMSAVYESTNTETLMVAFSVPIWSGPAEDSSRERIGVLGMCVELGEFAIGRRALLVDSRIDQLEGKPGLVLHHARLGVRSSGTGLPRLDPTILQQGLTLRLDRNQADRFFGEARSSIIEDFIDPLDQRTHLAAIEPVIIRGRPADIADTGWLVIAEEPAE